MQHAKNTRDPQVSEPMWQGDVRLEREIEQLGGWSNVCSLYDQVRHKMDTQGYESLTPDEKGIISVFNRGSMS